MSEQQILAAYKLCPECHGGMINYRCSTCSGEGRVKLTPAEIDLATLTAENERLREALDKILAMQEELEYLAYVDFTPFEEARELVGKA